ncbi:MAG: hypothetical protein H0T73_05060 [Ardenticatenales bacterium]|nr:hypothetical protein [Ardenticatenales bacterium]
MKVITTQDTHSSETLEVRYDPEAGTYWINNAIAERETDFESPEEYLFTVRVTYGKKFHHLSRVELDRLSHATDDVPPT